MFASDSSFEERACISHDKFGVRANHSSRDGREGCILRDDVSRNGLDRRIIVVRAAGPIWSQCCSQRTVKCSSDEIPQLS